jgi:hypothetical protein
MLGATPPAGLDNIGVTLFNNIKSLSTRIVAMRDGAVKEAANIELDKLQREMMLHCLETGFVTAASILSTMS